MSPEQKSLACRREEEAPAAPISSLLSKPYKKLTFQLASRENVNGKQVKAQNKPLVKATGSEDQKKAIQIPPAQKSEDEPRLRKPSGHNPYI